jgi:anti-sigma regulatory factor (Ser/Thr protein kinase)
VIAPAVGVRGPAPVRLRLPARPESLTVVRQALSGVAAVVGLDGEDLDDLKVAVTEACTNVVLHAYPGSEGPLEVEAWGEPKRMTVLVRDEGAGISPRAHADGPGLGLGLQLIAALAADVRISADPGRGTEVVMTFGASPRAPGLE